MKKRRVKGRGGGGTVDVDFVNNEWRRSRVGLGFLGKRKMQRRNRRRSGREEAAQSHGGTSGLVLYSDGKDRKNRGADGYLRKKREKKGV